MLILFFDTYIVASGEGRGGSTDVNNRVNKLSALRDKKTTYRWRDKIDIVKYTLASYANIDWDKVIIRFECEDPSSTDDFMKYCQLLFPTAVIQNERSDTAKKYYDALSTFKKYGDPWIFFSPNNDHPYLSDPTLLKKYVNLANKFEIKNPGSKLGILFSHFTESMIDNRMIDPWWGYFRGSFKKIIYEDEDCIISRSNKAANDSIYIFKLSYFLNIFYTTKNKGRVVKLEDTEFFMSDNLGKILTLAPKIELCRHYDGYSSLDSVPPLFIPDGFFESRIKIRYGFDKGVKGHININPMSDALSEDVDLMNTIEDIPFFWKDKISEKVINPSFSNNLNQNDLIYYKNLHNPFYNKPKILNILRSTRIYMLFSIRNFLLFILKIVGCYEFARDVKKRIIG
ncbi:hypothetical protein OAY03_00950 [Candidatus Thioglobus sp.]|nr:hypothetical protein [Candidatus Thioglobus sp.]